MALPRRNIAQRIATTPRLLLSLLIVFVAQSCTHKLDNFDNDDLVGKGLYVALYFDVEVGSNFQTRSNQSIKDEPYERKISDFRVFLADPINNAVVEIVDVEMAHSRATKPFLVASEYIGWQLYVVANSALSANLAPNIGSYEAFRGVYALNSVECQNVWAPNHFLMASVNNSLRAKDLSATCGSGIPIEADDISRYSILSPYQMNVTLERLAAKITVDCSNVDFNFNHVVYPEHNTFVSAEIDGVALINCVNQFNLVQQWKKGVLYNYMWDNFFQNKGLNPYNPPELYGYPYIWCVTPSDNIFYDANQGYYNKLTDFVDFENLCMTPQADGMFRNPHEANEEQPLIFYCLENNSPKYLEFINDWEPSKPIEGVGRWEGSVDKKMKKRTTGVLFRVRARLASAEAEAETEAQAQQGEDIIYPTFYSYYSSKTNSNCIYANLETLLAQNSEFAAAHHLTTSSSVKELRKAGIGVFEDGYMYYVYYLQDQINEYIVSLNNSGNSGNTFNPYAVLRNTLYEVIVDSIRNLGMDIPGREWVSLQNESRLIEGTNYLNSPTNWNYSYLPEGFDILDNYLINQ